jgi:hypothetical protein
MTKTELIAKTKRRIRTLSYKRDVYSRRFGIDDFTTNEHKVLIKLCEKILRDIKTLPE